MVHVFSNDITLCQIQENKNEAKSVVLHKVNSDPTVSECCNLFLIFNKYNDLSFDLTRNRNRFKQKCVKKQCLEMRYIDKYREHMMRFVISLEGSNLTFERLRFKIITKTL